MYTATYRLTHIPGWYQGVVLSRFESEPIAVGTLVRSKSSALKDARSIIEKLRAY